MIDAIEDRRFSLNMIDQLGYLPIENDDFAEISQHDVLALQIAVDHLRSGHTPRYYRR